jgi:serine protease
MYRFANALAVTVLAALAAATILPATAAEKMVRLSKKFVAEQKVATALDNGQRVRVLVVLKDAESRASTDFALLNGTPGKRQFNRLRVQNAQNRVVSEALNAMLETENGKHRIRRYDGLPIMAVSVNKSDLDKLGAHASVASIQEDGYRTVMLNDSRAIVGANAAATAGFDGTGQAVAVLDTGVQLSHPFLSGKIIGEACFSSAGGNAGLKTNCPNGKATQTGPGAAAACTTATSACAHGTHTAGIAVGRNPTATANPAAGIAAGAKLIPIQVFTPDNAGNIGAYDSDIIAALQWVNTQQVNGAFNPIKIAAVNMSLGGGAYTGNCDMVGPAMKSAIDALRANGILTVVASGNAGLTGQMSFPACISSAVSVASSTKQGGISSFSNLSATTDVYGPGSAILSSVPTNTYATYSGTSMAAPHVAGAVAIVRQKAPNATADQIEAALKTTGTPLAGRGYSIPVIRVDLALAQFAGTTTSPPPAPTPPAPPQPAPTNPAPTNPAPTNPAPANPAPTNPAPTNPAPAPQPAKAGITVAPTGGVVLSYNRRTRVGTVATTYTIKGVGGTAPFTISVTGRAIPNWLRVSPTTGSATTGGSAVTLQLTTALLALRSGVYSTTLNFTNGNGGAGTTRRTVTVILY